MKKFVATVLMLGLTLLIAACGGNQNDEGISLAASDVSNVSTPEPAAVSDVAYITIRGEQFSTALTELVLDDWYLQNHDIIPLRYMTNLTMLAIWDAQISDITPLAGLTNLVMLNLEENQISDITALSGLTNLEGLILSDNQINNITPLAGLTNLVVLELFDNQISDISPLAGLMNLVELGLSGNPISDIAPLSELTNLVELWLSGNHISDSDILLLAGLSNLEVLDLENNQISDITPLSELTNLERLFLSYNQIGDIAPLTGLANLESLGLRDNPVRDWSPVASVERVSGRPEPMPEMTIVENDIVDISNLYFWHSSVVTQTGVVVSDTYNVSGMATNIGDRPLSTLGLTIRVLDAQGRGVGSSRTFVVVHPNPWLMPGESRMWDAWFDRNENMESLSIEVDSFRFQD